MCCCSILDSKNSVLVLLVNLADDYFQVGVYRMSNERIGCSLADAAATSTYMEYLEPASRSTSLHVIYINTKLETKAYAHELMPTITCTSSNVIQTILQVSKMQTLACSSLSL
jgi:quinolinate synthase